MSELKSYRFCSLEELNRSKRVTRIVEELRDEITAIDLDGKTHVFSSVCPHFGGEFKFDRRAGKTWCKWHGYEFDIRSGKCLTFPKLKTCLRHYEFQENDGYLEVLYH